jgi:cephalosporin hydroxylase
VTHPWLTDEMQTTYMGIHTLQAWPDLVVWEKLFARHRLGMVIELGTYRGGMSLFLLGHCLQRETTFWTIGNDHKVNDSPLAKALGLAACCLDTDVFASGANLLQQMLQSERSLPLLLLCDNGNKPREVQTFTPLLQSGDILAAHDWGHPAGPRAIRSEDVFPVNHLLRPLYWEECEAIEAITRFWIRV